MSRANVNRKVSIYINGAEVENSLRGVEGELRRVQNSLRGLVEGTDDYEKKKRELRATLAQLRDRQAEYRQELDLTNNSYSRAGFSVANMTRSLIAAFSIGSAIEIFIGAVKGAFKTINDFEQGVADLSAITGATGKDLEYLKQQAITLGAETKGGATAVVEAYKLIASAKPELLDNVEALNQVTEATLLLAQASGMEMPEAATALTDAMNQFGADAEQAAIFVDALANGAKYGAAEIPAVTEALLKFGAVARSSNVSIQESTALVELLAENGIKGADAGTALRNVLLKLSAPDALPKEARAEMERLGISMGFLKDKTVPIQEKLEALKPLLKDNASIVKIFGTENATAAINVIEHTSRLKALTSKMNEAGTAQEQAAKKMDTVNGRTELLKSKYDSLILSIGTGSGVVSGFFKFFIQGASDATDGLIRLNTSWDDLYKKARQDGAKSGRSIFQERFGQLKGTGSDAEIAKTIKTTAEKEYKTLQEAYKENETKLKNLQENGFKYARLYGISEADAKKNKEDLTRDILERVSIIRESGKIIAKAKQEAEAPVKTNTENTKTQAEVDAAQKAAEAKKLAYEKAEIELDRLIEDHKDKRRINALKGIEKEIAQVEVKYQNEFEKYRGHKDKLVELEKLKQQEINDIKLEKQAEYEAQIDAIEKQLAIDKEASRLEALANNATTEEERQAILIDKARFLAEAEIQSDLEKELAKVENVENAEELKQAIRDKYAQKSKESKDKLDFAEKTIQKDKVTWTKLTEEQKVDLVKNALNAAADAFNKGSDAWKAIKIAETSIATYQSAVNSYTSLSSIPVVGPALGTAAAALAIVSGLKQIQNITNTKIETAPKFFSGGYTGSNASLGYDQFGAVTGYVHDHEYVIPKVMTQDPAFADTIGWLEHNRQQKIKGYADGGSTSGSVVVAGTNQTQQVDMLLLAQTLNSLNSILAGGIQAKVLIGYQEVAEIDKMNNEIIASKNNGIIG